MLALRKIQEEPLDELIAFYTDPENSKPLSAKKMDVLEYLEMADNLIMRYGCLHPTPQLLLTRINRKRADEGKDALSIKTIYNYIYNAQKFFGSVRSLDKPYWRQIMVQKEFERYLKAIAIGNDKAAKGASEEMRRWGGFEMDDALKIDKKDIGEKNQVLVISIKDQAFQLDLDDTFRIPTEQLQHIMGAIEQHNMQKMIDNLTKEAEDAEYTTTDAE